MTEESAVKTSKKKIAEVLRNANSEHAPLLKSINNIGHGRVVFEAAINEMIGANEVERYREKRKRFFRLTEKGRKIYLNGS